MLTTQLTTADASWCRTGMGRPGRPSRLAAAATDCCRYVRLVWISGLIALLAACIPLPTPNLHGEVAHGAGYECRTVCGSTEGTGRALGHWDGNDVLRRLQELCTPVPLCLDVLSYAVSHRLHVPVTYQQFKKLYFACDQGFIALQPGLVRRDWK